MTERKRQKGEVVICGLLRVVILVVVLVLMEGRSSRFNEASVRNIRINIILLRFSTASPPMSV